MKNPPIELTSYTKWSGIVALCEFFIILFQTFSAIDAWSFQINKFKIKAKIKYSTYFLIAGDYKSN